MTSYLIAVIYLVIHEKSAPGQPQIPPMFMGPQIIERLFWLLSLDANFCIIQIKDLCLYHNTSQFCYRQEEIFRLFTIQFVSDRTLSTYSIRLVEPQQIINHNEKLNFSPLFKLTLINCFRFISIYVVFVKDNSNGCGNRDISLYGCRLYRWYTVFW